MCVCLSVCTDPLVAFYDPVMYDSLRQLVVEAQQPTGAQHLEALLKALELRGNVS